MNAAEHVARAPRRPAAKQLSFGPQDHGSAVSDEDAERAEYQPGFRYEIIDGRIFVSPAADLPHDEVLGSIHDALLAYKLQRPDLIKRISASACVFVSAKSRLTAPEPDLAVYNRFQRSTLWKKDWRNVSP